MLEHGDYAGWPLGAVSQRWPDESSSGRIGASRVRSRPIKAAKVHCKFIQSAMELIKFQESEFVAPRGATHAKEPIGSGALVTFNRPSPRRASLLSPSRRIPATQALVAFVAPELPPAPGAPTVSTATIAAAGSTEPTLPPPSPAGPKSLWGRVKNWVCTIKADGSAGWRQRICTWLVLLFTFVMPKSCVEYSSYSWRERLQSASPMRRTSRA